jgi:hypothetical protein
VEAQLHAFLTLALDWGEWSASHPGCFTPKERTSGTHWIGGWVGPRAGLDMVVRRKIPRPYWDLNPNHPAPSPLLYHWVIPGHLRTFYKSIISMQQRKKIFLVHLGILPSSVVSVNIVLQSKVCLRYFNLCHCQQLSDLQWVSAKC